MTRFIVVFLAVTILGHASASTPIAIGCPFLDQDRCKPCLRHDPDPNKVTENKWSNVTEVELDRTELRLPAPKPGKEGSPPTYPDYSNDLRAIVKTTASDPEDDVMMYSYTISGGRIVGTGANVTWDLNGVRPGTYTITAGVDDGCGVCGKTVTKTIRVFENESTPACVCHEIRIDPQHLKVRSANWVFVANLSGPKRPDLTYNWTISAGTMLSGQDTDRITVARPPEGSEQT